MQELTIDEEFYFQWHLTERCNRACRHCYQNGSPTSELGLNDLLTIVDLMEGAINKWETTGTLSLTGGEPFLRKDDLHALMDHIDCSDALAYYDILTNGSLITKDEVIALARHPKLRRGPSFLGRSNGKNERHCAGAQEALTPISFNKIPLFTIQE